VREDNVWLHLADHGGEPTQEFQLIQNLQVVAKALVEVRAEDFGGAFGLGAADDARLPRVVLHAAATAVAKVQVVRVPTCALEQHERSGHVKLDVVRVRADGDGGLHGASPQKKAKGGMEINLVLPVQRG